LAKPEGTQSLNIPTEIHRLVKINALMRGMSMQELIAQSVNWYLQLPADDQAVVYAQMGKTQMDAEQALKDMRDPSKNPNAEFQILLDKARDERLKSKVNLENSSAHTLIDQLIAARPETAKNMLATIRALLKEEPIEAKVVPAQAKSKPVSKGARAFG
jgi:hypothetical protein